MRRLALAFALLSVSCSRPDQAKRDDAPAKPTPITVAADGDPYALRFQGNALTFCDKRGSRKLDLGSGTESSAEQACPKNDEPNTACSGLSLDISVRSPAGQPSDIIDFGAQSFPLPGHVHDCAAEAKTLAVTTGSNVVLIDLAKNATIPVSSEGADRVALSPTWVAWTNGSKVHAALRSTPK